MNGNTQSRFGLGLSEVVRHVDGGGLGCCVVAGGLVAGGLVAGGLVAGGLVTGGLVAVGFVDPVVLRVGLV